MINAPQVEDPRKWDFEYNDREEMIFKQNALNQWRFDFSEQLKTMCSELDTEFQFVAESRIDITNMSGQVATALQQVNTAKQSVDQSKTHIDQQKGLIDTAAGQVSDHAQQVATDRQAVADDRLASQQAADVSSDAAGASIQAKDYAQQAATDAGEERGLAETARTDAETAQEASEQAASTSQQVADAVASDRAHVDQHKQAIDTTAGQVSQNAQQVASDKQVVAQDRQAAADAAQAAGSSAGDALTAKQQAEALYGDLDAVNTAKTQSQQAAITAGEQRALAVTARQGAEQALADALQAAADANVDIDAAIAALVDSSPEALNTLNELAAALGNDPNFSTTMLNALAEKANATGSYSSLRARATTKGDVGLGNVQNVDQTNASNLSSGTVPIARISSTSSRTSSSTSALLHAKAMNDHRVSGDHDDRYLKISDAGSASGKTAQANPMDATSGRLMQVGAFGLGETSGVTANSDIFENTLTGFYRSGSGDANAPPGSGTGGGYIRFGWGGGWETYLYGDPEQDELFFVNRQSGNSKGWKKVYHTDNQLALGTTATSGRSALGLGSAATSGTTASRTSASTSSLLQAKAMNDHRTSSDHDSRYVLQSGYNAFNPTGNYPSLRARGTTKGDVGLSNIPNEITASRELNSDDHLLTARGMNAHRTSGDHDNRYYTKSQANSEFWRLGAGTGYAPSKDLNDYGYGEGGYLRGSEPNSPPGYSTALNIQTLPGYGGSDSLQLAFPGRTNDRFLMRVGRSEGWRPWIEFWNSGNSDSFNASGNYSGLRARATTKSDVGLSDVDNLPQIATSGNQTASGVKTFTGSINVNGSSSTPDLVLTRTNAPYNALMKFVTTGTGDVYIGQGDAGHFVIGSNTDLRYSNNNARFDVDTTNGDVKWKGTASGDGSGITNINASNISTGTISFSRVPSTSSRTSTSTSHALTASAMNNHRTSGDHDSRYVLQSGYTAFNPAGTYTSLRARGTTKTDVGLSDVVNVNVHEYGLGSSGKNLDDFNTAARENFFFGGGGSSSSNAGPGGYSPGINLYRSSSDRRSQLIVSSTNLAFRGATGDDWGTWSSVWHGGNLDPYDAANITKGSIDYSRIPSTTSRTSSSTSHALTASAMNDHRTSGDHDGRYYTKGQVDSLVDSSNPKSFNVSGSYALLVHDRDGSGDIHSGAVVSASKLSLINLQGSADATSTITGSWKLMSGTIRPTAVTNSIRAGLWIKL